MIAASAPTTNRPAPTRARQPGARVGTVVRRIAKTLAVTTIVPTITLWLLHTLSITGFVTAKTVYGPAIAVLGAAVTIIPAVTIILAVPVARREGLLHIAPYGSTELVVAA